MEKYQIYFILGGILAAIILVLFGLYQIKLWKIRKLGKDGEKKVAGILKRFAGIRSYKVLNDVYLPLYDKTTQIDHILIGFFGILVVETKNMKGEIYGDPKKKDWSHIVGGKKRTFYNPLMQNQTHIDCIRHWLGKEGVYNVTIETAVVFTNSKLDLYVPNRLPIFRLKSFKKFLHQSRFEKDANFDVDKITSAIIKNQVTDKALISQHNKNVKIMSKG